MLDALYPAIRPLLFSLEPEFAHHITLAALSELGTRGLLGASPAPSSALSVRVMGIDFPNPIGLAAGLDKNGIAIDGLAALGFGFIEVGTVTPLAQAGNAKPRMFRLKSANALINRMGFNNAGLDAFLANVSRSKYRGVLGLNIGKNASTPPELATHDYLAGLRGVYPRASYVTVNISSPNTIGLRLLQEGDALDGLLGSLKEEQRRLTEEYGRHVPLALKIAPDLDEVAIREIAKRLLSHEIEGVIATNTTTDHSAVADLKHGAEAGGLSGAPLREASTKVIARLKAELGDALPIIGAGGIMSGDDALEKIRAGAKLVQIYTGLIYRGPRLIDECLAALRQDASSLG
jgi:dihydroorotate dehydrogenase